MKFSVLMPVYGKENPFFLTQALQSIWDNQTLKPNEIVIIKDGPLTNELEIILSNFAKIAPTKIKALKENVGIGKALNIGVNECSFDYIARMDSDDIAFPDRFYKQINFLEQHPKIGIVSSFIDEFINTKDNIISTRKVPLSHEQIIENLKGRCPLNHPAVVFKKEAVLAAGNYQPFFLKEDIYLWLRLFENKTIFANINESLLYFRITKETYKRRGGLQYAISEFKILKYRFDIGLINIFQLFYFIFLSVPIRLAPAFIRSFIYSRFLR